MVDQRFIDAMQALKDLGENVAVPMKGGKMYTMVKDRIEIFRSEFGAEFGITTQVDCSWGFDHGAAIVAQAQISDGQRIIASGWAVEFVGSTKLTDASPVEVAETSAIGRALACFGLHGGEYSSLNEMVAHDRKQNFRDDGRRGDGRGDDRNDDRRGNGHDDRRDRPDDRRDRPDPRDDRRNPRDDRDDDRRDDRRDPPNRQVAQKSQWYVPTDEGILWKEGEQETQRIISEVDGIGTTHELTRYWSDLKPTIDILKTDKDVGMDLIAEIKAAFATRHNMLGAR
jgi:hypothetical protein